MATFQDATQGTAGWYSSACGTVGIAKGQTARLSVVNVGAVDAVILPGLWQNPEPIALMSGASFTLRPGHGKELDVRAADIGNEHFDRRGRVQVRALVKSSHHMVRANLEIFDEQTGQTSIVLPLQNLAREA